MCLPQAEAGARVWALRPEEKLKKKFPNRLWRSKPIITVISLATERDAPLVIQRLVLLGSSVRGKPLLKCLFGLNDVRSSVRIDVAPHDGLCLFIEGVEQPG